MTKLILHIGIHRTGTTGLQRNLSGNRERLKALDIAYPFEQTNHQDLAWAIHRGDLTGADMVEKLQPYADCAKIVLSGEDFCIHRSLAWLDPLKHAHDVEAVIYLRRQDHWIMSWYNQHVKWPFSRRHSLMTPQEFLASVEDFYWIDFNETVSRWEDALGKDRVHVRIVEAGEVRDAVGDFLAIAGIDASKLEIDSSQHNDSLPIETLEFARRADMSWMKPGKRMAVINFLRSVVASPAHTGKTLFTAIERQALLDRFADSNCTLARRRFDRDALFLEEAPHDRDLYVEGSLGASIGFDEIVEKAVKYIGAEHR
jgi:hypothetical protein